jgi:hypothetical protein
LDNLGASSPIKISNYYSHGWCGRIPWKYGFYLGGIPPHLGDTGGKGGWSFLSSSPSYESNEELEEPLCGSPHLPFAEECLLDYLFEGGYHLVPWDVDNCKFPFCLLLGRTMLKYTLSIVVASLLGLEGRVVT